MSDAMANATKSAPAAGGMSVIDEIAAERRRQIEDEGWTEEHDDQTSDGAMAVAAGCYAISAGGRKDLHWADAARTTLVPRGWPWAAKWWKPKTPRRDLIRAAALIVAEIERRDRKDTPPMTDKSESLAAEWAAQQRYDPIYDRVDVGDAFRAGFLAGRSASMPELASDAEIEKIGHALFQVSDDVYHRKLKLVDAPIRARAELARLGLAIVRTK